MTISIKSNGDSTGAIQHNAVDRVTFNSDGSMSYAKSQRGTVTSDNDLAFDMSATNNFTCTPTSSGTLAFTNISIGQSGNIRLINGSNYAISKSSYIKCSSGMLGTISSTGIYWLSYYSPDGIDVLVSNTGALS